MTINKSTVLKTSLWHGRPYHGMNEMVSLFRHKLSGAEFLFGFQKHDGNWYHSRGKDWNNEIRSHLWNRSTLGIFPTNHSSMVTTMAIDIDDHAAKYEGHFQLLFEEKVVPVKLWYEKYGIRGSQILVESTGAGFHLWFFANPAIPVFYAFNFLQPVREEYGVEIFPCNTKLPSQSKPIRLPLGLHRKRYAEKKPGQVSRLCTVHQEFSQPIQTIDGSLDLLKSWEPLSKDQVLEVTGRFASNIFYEGR